MLAGGGVDVWIRTFLACSLVACERSASKLEGESTPYPLVNILGGPNSQCGRQRSEYPSPYWDSNKHMNAKTIIPFLRF
jgi:hypothetical protein